MSNDFPIMVSLTLFNYNYLDNKLIAAIKQKAYIIPNSSNTNSFVVAAWQIIDILRTDFDTEISTALNFPKDKLFNVITSPYQLYDILTYYPNLTTVVIKVSFDKDYTRLTTSNGVSILSMDYIIEKCAIDYTRLLTDSELTLFNSLLRDLNYITTIRMRSFYNVNLGKFLNDIESLSMKLLTKYERIIEINNGLFSQKIILDNPIAIIITDPMDI